MAARRTARSPTAANALLGLQQLGLRLDWDSSILHELADRLPTGMFDGHGSVFPAPDHMIFHGLARCCLKALFKALPKAQKLVVTPSLRDALHLCGLRSTNVFNARRDKVNSVQIHEWAAVLAVSPVACCRGLPVVMGGRPLALSAVGALLAAVDTLSAFASAAYFYPRVDLDGGRACRQRYKTNALEELGARFMLSVNKLCLRPDCDLFSGTLDVPSTHRFRELMLKTVHGLGHIRNSLELHLEGFHQTLKRSIVRGNGRDDAAKGMRRCVDQELASRLSLDASVFGVPSQWCSMPGVREQLTAACPLWSLDSDNWALGTARMRESNMPDQERLLATRLFPSISNTSLN